MWQHAVNILFGAGLMLVSSIGSLMGTITSVYAWIFGVAGLVVLLVAFWGLAEEIYYEELHRRFDTVL